MLRIVVGFVVLFTSGCTSYPYLPQHAGFSNITKAKEVEAGVGGSFYWIDQGYYGKAGYGLSKHFSTHASAFAQIGLSYNVHISHQYRFHTALGEKWRISSELGGFYGNANTAIIDIIDHEQWNGSYTGWFNQTYFTLSNKKNHYYAGAKLGSLYPNFSFSKTLYTGKTTTTKYQNTNLLLTPFIGYQFLFNDNIQIQSSYSTAFLWETDLHTRSSLPWNRYGSFTIGGIFIF